MILVYYNIILILYSGTQKRLYAQQCISSWRIQTSHSCRLLWYGRFAGESVEKISRYFDMGESWNRRRKWGESLCFEIAGESVMFTPNLTFAGESWGNQNRRRKWGESLGFEIAGESLMVHTKLLKSPAKVEEMKSPAKVRRKFRIWNRRRKCDGSHQTFEIAGESLMVHTKLNFRRRKLRKSKSPAKVLNFRRRFRLCEPRVKVDLPNNYRYYQSISISAVNLSLKIKSECTWDMPQ